MPEITIYGWKCDICGKEFFEKDSSYNNQYRVSIEPANAKRIDRDDIYYGYVCQSCKDSIIEYIKLPD